MKYVYECWMPACRAAASFFQSKLGGRMNKDSMSARVIEEIYDGRGVCLKEKYGESKKAV